MKWYATLGFVCCSLFAAFVFAAPRLPHYSNMIIFGDSQSDIGNFPESSNAGLTVPFALNGMPYNLYVPFSNPVDSTANALLPPQPPINKKFARTGRSLNWTQHLFAFLRKDGRLQSSTLLPWVTLMTQQKHTDAFVSVNYAFGGALSNDDCANEAYTKMPDSSCSAADILKTQNLYRQNSSQFKLRNVISIPGTQRQIGLFAHDLQTGKVKVDHHTIYLVFTGANDLSASFKSLIAGGSAMHFYQTISKTIPNLIAGPNHSIITRLTKLGAKNIVILGMQNLALAPEASVMTRTSESFVGRYLNAYLLNFLILRYNLALAKDIATAQQQYPNLKIHYVNLQFLFNRLSLLPQGPFYQHVGEACQNKNAQTYQSIMEGKLVNCEGYLYWNGAHFTDLGYTIIAYAVLYFLN